MNPIRANAKIYYDVTGVLRWGAQLPTGIQRVEHSLAQYAAGSDDIGLVAYNFRLRRFAPLSPHEAAYLQHIFASTGNETPARTSRLSRSMAHMRAQIAHNNVETGRRIAAQVSGDASSSTLTFGAAKTIARLMLWSGEGLRSAWLGIKSLRPGADKTADQWAGQNSLCLMSHAVSLRQELPAAAAAARLRPVFIVHDLIPVLDKSYAETRFASRFAEFVAYALGRSEPIVTLSNAVRNDVRKWGADTLGLEALPPIDVRPFPNSIDPPGALTHPITQLQGRRFVLFCSTINPRKNQHLLVAAWNRLSLVLGDALPDLVLIGRPAKRYAPLTAALSAASAIAHKIHILHGIDDAKLRWAYRNAYFGVFPSSAEGWGLGVSECLTYGLPVLHSDIPALIEASQGLMPTVTVDDGDALYEGLLSLLSLPDTVEALRVTARTNYKAGSADGFAASVFDGLRNTAS